MKKSSKSHKPSVRKRENSTVLVEQQMLTARSLTPRRLCRCWSATGPTA